MIYRRLFADLERFTGIGAIQLSDQNHALYEQLLRDDTPLLDVRAPIEFAKGAFPSAHNIPLLDDDERAAVGTRYKQAGQDAAIALGNQLVTGDTKAARLDAWTQWLAAHPGAWLYCFRGGLRSQTVEAWLQEAGVTGRRVPGGYKAMRQYLSDTIDAAPQGFELMIVAGPTGSGKTHLINALPCSLDLEGYAQHRGSAFGKMLGGQPSQINFENALAVRLLKLQQWQGQRLFVEDESQAIGSLAIPQTLHGAMKTSPIALIEEAHESRATTILQDYIEDNLHRFRAADPSTAQTAFADYLLGSLEKIQRRLGPERYGQIKGMMQEALREQAAHGDTQGHREWITRLLIDYYDPMYAYQLAKRLERVVFRGSAEEFLDWAAKP